MTVKSTLAAAQKSCWDFPINDMIIHTLSAKSRYVNRVAEQILIEAPDDEELEREVQRKQAENIEKSNKLKQIKDDEDKIVRKINIQRNSLKLIKQAQELKRVTYFIRGN